MDYNIDSSDLKRVQKKLKDMPGLLDKNMKTAMNDSLLILHGNVLPYPPEPEGSSYRRTGTLGRSLMSTKDGEETVYSISGSGINTMGKFGTKIVYAKYVIGEPGAPSYPPGQAWMHKMWWWTIGDILKRSQDKITKVWATMVRVVLNKKL
jgi:hypothetical protein